MGPGPPPQMMVAVPEARQPVATAAVAGKAMALVAIGLLAVHAGAVAAAGSKCGPRIPPEYCCNFTDAGYGYSPAKQVCAVACKEFGIQLPMKVSCLPVDPDKGFNSSVCISPIDPPGDCSIYEFMTGCDDPKHDVDVCYGFEQAIFFAPFTVDRSQGYANAFDVVFGLNKTASLPGSLSALQYTNFLIKTPSVTKFLYSKQRLSACGNVGPNHYKAACTCADQLQISQCGKFEACKAFDPATREACCSAEDTEGPGSAGSNSSCI